MKVFEKLCTTYQNDGNALAQCCKHLTHAKAHAVQMAEIMGTEQANLEQALNIQRGRISDSLRQFKGHQANITSTTFYKITLDLFGVFKGICVAKGIVGGDAAFDGWFK